MREQKKGKYSMALSGITEPEVIERTAPQRPSKLQGKRSTPGWSAKTVITKDETTDAARAKLAANYRATGHKMDLSDLVQSLLEGWLKEPH